MLCLHGHKKPNIDWNPYLYSVLVFSKQIIFDIVSKYCFLLKTQFCAKNMFANLADHSQQNQNTQHELLHKYAWNHYASRPKWPWARICCLTWARTWLKKWLKLGQALAYVNLLASLFKSMYCIHTCIHRWTAWHSAESSFCYPYPIQNIENELWDKNSHVNLSLFLSSDCMYTFDIWSLPEQHN